MGISESYTPLPSKAVRIQLASGEADPVYVSVSNLVRMGADDFRRVLQWIESERARRAERQAVVEGELEKEAEARREEIEQRHAAMTKHLESHPWEKHPA